MKLDKLSIFAQKRNIRNFTFIAGLFFIAYAVLLKLYWIKLGFILSMVVAGVCAFMAWMMFYGIRLMIENESILHLEVGGIYDGASPFEYGNLNYHELDGIFITNILGVYFLTIKTSNRNDR